MTALFLQPRSLLLLVPLALVACTTVTPLAPFFTDGCSLFPDRSITERTDWCDCCLAHDLAYWRGGTEEDRLRADRNLRTCVEQKTRDSVLAEAMFLGVRTGGGPQVNTPFRWGYGWPYGRGYQALSEAESVSVKALEEKYRAGNPRLQCRTEVPTADLRTNPNRQGQGADNSQ